jgi:tetratricopeptide (TPR) repeat protein
MTVESPLQIGLEYLKAGRYDDAIKELESLTRQKPDDCQAFTYLGAAYAKKGLYDRAIATFQAALRLKSDSPAIHFNLGLAYQCDGFIDQARDEYETALRYDPAYAKASEALQKLEIDAVQNAGLGQSCARHSDEPAIGVCYFCHLPICQECKVVRDNHTYCSKCAEHVG